MSDLGNFGRQIWRDWGVDNVPSTGAHEPEKADIRAFIAMLDEQLNGLLATGPIFGSTAAGIAATSDGDYFLVKGSGDTYASLYANSSGVATAQNISVPSRTYITTVLNRLENRQTIGRPYAVAATDGTALGSNVYVQMQPVDNDGYIRAFRYFGKSAGTGYIRVWSAAGDVLTMVREVAVAISTGAQTAVVEIPVSKDQVVGFYGPNLISYTTAGYPDETGFWTLSGNNTTSGTGTQNTASGTRLQFSFDVFYQGVNNATLAADLKRLRLGTEWVQVVGRPRDVTLVTQSNIPQKTYVRGDLALYDGRVSRIRVFMMVAATIFVGVFTVSGDTKTTTRWYPIQTASGANDIELDIPILAGQAIGYYAYGASSGQIAYNASETDDGAGVWESPSNARVLSFSDSTLSTAGRAQISFEIAYVRERSDASYISPRYPIGLEKTKAYLPIHYHRTQEGGTNRLLAPADGAKYWVVDTSTTLTGLTRYFSSYAQFLATGNPIVVSTASLPPVYPTRDLVEIGRAINGVFSSLYPVAGGLNGGSIAPNQFEEGNDPDRAQIISSTGTVTIVDVADAELTALGFLRGVRATPAAGNAYAALGSSLKRKTTGQEKAFGRVYCRTNTVGNFGAPQLYFFATAGDTDGTTNLRLATIDLELEEVISDTIRIYSIATDVPAGADFYQIGSYITTGGVEVTVGGAQFAIRQDGPIGWIKRDDYFTDEDQAIGRPLMGADLWAVTGRPLNIYPQNIQRSNRPDNRVITTISFPRADGDVPYSVILDGHQGVELDPSRIVNGGVADVRLYPDRRNSSKAWQQSLTCHVVAGTGRTGAPVPLIVGSSHANRRTAALIDLKLKAMGYTSPNPVWVGTINTSNVDGAASNTSGPLGEVREGRSWAELLNIDTSRDGYPAPLPEGQEDFYLGLSKTEKLLWNPFLRLATGGDSPSVIKNGWVWDFGWYLTRFAGKTAGGVNVVEPTHFVNMLGGNESSYYPIADIQSNIAEAVPLFLDSIFAVSGSIQVGLATPLPAYSQYRFARYQNWVATIDALDRAITKYGSANAKIIPIWMHGNPYSDFVLDASPAADTANGYHSRMPGQTDPRHSRGTPRSEAAEPVAAWIANTTAPA